MSLPWITESKPETQPQQAEPTAAPAKEQKRKEKKGKKEKKLAEETAVVDLKALFDNLPGHDALDDCVFLDADGKHHRSPSELEWESRKAQGETNEALDELMSLTGLENVKAKILSMKAWMEMAKQQGVNLADERLNIALLGNPGVGKTEVAKQLVKCLEELKIVPGKGLFETTGVRLNHSGDTLLPEKVDGMFENGGEGGIVIIDDAHQITEYDLDAVIDCLANMMETRRGRVIFIFAGQTKGMNDFMGRNAGLKEHIPFQLSFDDFAFEELMQIFTKSVQKKFSNRMRIEGGLDGCNTRVLIRRIARQRGKPGFSNARAVQNALARVCERQATRINAMRKDGKVLAEWEYFCLNAADMIGTEPLSALRDSPAWEELKTMVGLEVVKRSLQAIVDVVALNWQRELAEKDPLQMGLSRLFLGPTGTGKTTVARLYGQILAKTGLLSCGELLEHTASDFIGNHIGDSEKNTRTILNNARGKVLLIDEAYMLNPHRNCGSRPCPFRQAAIDTLVSIVQNVPGDDRCVILMGYDKPMLDLISASNAGLARRFPLSEAFLFDNFNEHQLLAILELKMVKQEIAATAQAKEAAMALLRMQVLSDNFGNGGEVENVLSRAKQNFAARVARRGSRRSNSADVLLEAVDFDPRWQTRNNTLAITYIN